MAKKKNKTEEENKEPVTKCGQDLIGYAKSIFPVYEISPDGIVLAAARKRHQQTIGIKKIVVKCYLKCLLCIKNEKNNKKIWKFRENFLSLQ